MKRGGTSYIATAGHVASSATEPGVGADWQAVWDTLAQKGDSGVSEPLPSVALTMLRRNAANDGFDALNDDETVDALKDGVSTYRTFESRTTDPDAPSSGIRVYTKDFGHGGLIDLWGRPIGMPAFILAPAPLDENLILNVPTDYATISEAIEAWASRPIKRGVVVDLNLVSGYAIPEGVLLQDGDYSHFRITADDATVFLDAGFSGVPQQTSDTFEEGALFFGIRAEMPRLACLIDMNDVGGSGYLVALGSTGYIEGNCGVINSGKIGLYIKAGSHVPMAANCNFSGANWGNRVTTRSSLQAPTCNFSGTKQASYGGSGTTANLDVSRGSVVYVTGSPGSESDLSGGVSRGLGVRRSFVSATSVDCSGNFDGAVIGAGSNVTMNGSLASGNSNHGVAAGEGATVDATGLTATDNGVYNLYADAGAKIAARNSTLTGAGTMGVRAANGSTLVVNGSNCRRNGVSDQSTDIVCGEGSIIHAMGALGGTNTAVMTISTNGLIFKA